MSATHPYSTHTWNICVADISQQIQNFVWPCALLGFVDSPRQLQRLALGAIHEAHQKQTKQKTCTSEVSSDL